MTGSVCVLGSEWLACAGGEIKAGVAVRQEWVVNRGVRLAEMLRCGSGFLVRPAECHRSRWREDL